MAIEVLELYGRPLPARADAALRARLDAAYCPYRRYHCDRTDPAADSRAGIPHGICLVCDDTEEVPRPVPVCPSRMLAGGGVVVEDARRLLLQGGEGCELYLLAGMNIPGGGPVDYLLVSVRSGLPVDFVGLDLYPVSADGSIWPWRDRALAARGAEGAGADADGAVRDDAASPAIELNWRDSAKDLLSGLHLKLGFFERLGKRLVVALPEALAEFMVEEFAFDLIPRGHGRESLRLHAYAFDAPEPGPDGTEPPVAPPRLASRMLLDSVQVAMALGLQASVHEELSSLIVQFSGRLTPENLWRPDAAAPDPESPA